MIKAQIDVMKKIAKLVFFTLSFAFVITLSAPFSITSNAYAIGIESTQSAMDVLLGLGGLSGATPSGNMTWEEAASLGISQDDYLAFYGGFFDSANNYYSGLGDYLLSRVKLAASTGSLLLDKKYLDEYRDFVADTYGSSLGSAINIGSVDYAVNVYHSDSLLSGIYSFYRNGTFYEFPFSLTFDDSIDTDILVLCYSGSNSTSYYYYYYFIPLTYQSDVFCTISGTVQPGYLGPQGSCYEFQDFGYIASLTLIGNKDSYNMNFPLDYYTIPDFGTATLSSVISRFRTYGEVSVTEDITSVVLDPTSTIVVPNSIVGEDGEIDWSSTSIVLLDSSVVSSIFDLLQSGSITYNDLISSLNLGLVNDSTTIEEKQSVIDSISSSVVQSLTLSETGSAAITQSSSKVGTLAHIEHAIANAIALATGQALPYPDEDPDYVPPGDPHIQNWDFPSLDPDNPDPGGSEDPDSEDTNRAEDVAEGISVVADLAGDIFDSASGFNLVTTVGYSFVIFSAILGASHFFGALGGRHDDVKTHPLDWNRSERWSSKNTDFKSDW